jgi:hypothetical protein
MRLPGQVCVRLPVRVSGLAQLMRGRRKGH